MEDKSNGCWKFSFAFILLYIKIEHGSFEL